MMKTWELFFEQEKQKAHFRRLLQTMEEAYSGTRKIYPPREFAFRAFEATPLETVKVVIVGQDPYHEEGQAMGLSFSVPKGAKLPPSLRNIYRELEDDTGIKRGKNDGDLTSWAYQGVLLLNAYLMVEEGRPLSFASKDALAFAQDVLTYLDSLDQPIVFVLWGGFARKFAKELKNENHLVLEASHPSPLSANRGGFFGAKPFSKINAYLESKGKAPIDWGE